MFTITLEGEIYMDFSALTKESAIQYITECTDLFSKDAKLSVYEIGDGEEDGDGFVNFVFRIWDETGKSVILKQARSYAKQFGKKSGCSTFDPERNALEAKAMMIKQAITPEYLPEIYHFDEKNHLYICEDAGKLPILRFSLIKGEMYPKLDHMLAEYLAKGNFYTSDYYLDPEEKRKLQVCFMNSHLRHVFETILFLWDEHITPEHDPHILYEGSDALSWSDKVWNNKDLRIELLKLRDIHMKRADCLVHGDLHTSNILTDGNDLKIIDMEYAYFGPASSDMGYLIGSCLYEYLRWNFVDEFTPEKREELGLYKLNSIRQMLTDYMEIYKACWLKDARKTYKPYPELCDYLLKEWLKEVTGYAGCQPLSRVGRLVSLPDYDTITDPKRRELAQKQILVLSQYLVMHREEVESVDDLINMISCKSKEILAMLTFLDK